MCVCVCVSGNAPASGRLSSRSADVSPQAAVTGSGQAGSQGPLREAFWIVSGFVYLSTSYRSGMF